MPELPEVETIRAGLQRLLPGHVVAAVTHDNPKSFPNAAADVRQFLVGASIVLVARRAKVLLIELSTKYSLVIHLKMTGQLVYVRTLQEKGKRKRTKSIEAASPSTIYHLPSTALEERFGAGHPNNSLIGKMPDKSTRVIFGFTDGSHLYFNDQRKFGWVRLMPTAEIPQLDFFKKVGPEPLSKDFTWQILKERLERRKKTSVKAAILDQSVLAGVGNIYADESLWGAKIHPSTLVLSLSDKNIKDLHENIQSVLRLSIERGGSTDKNYVDAEGKRGSYLSFANVFRREGQPCQRCGTIIEKTRVAGRGTHICPLCQRVKK